MNEKLLKADEVAALLELSKSYVYQMIRTGQLPAVRFGTAVRVRPNDLGRFVLDNLVDGEKSLPPRLSRAGRM